MGYVRLSNFVKDYAINMLGKQILQFGTTDNLELVPVPDELLLFIDIPVLKERHTLVVLDMKIVANHNLEILKSSETHSSCNFLKTNAKRIIDYYSGRLYPVNPIYEVFFDELFFEEAYYKSHLRKNSFQANDPSFEDFVNLEWRSQFCDEGYRCPNLYDFSIFRFPYLKSREEYNSETLNHVRVNAERFFFPETTVSKIIRYRNG